MSMIFIFYLFVFILAFVLTYIVRGIALKRKILDIPNKRSSHDAPTPRGGGLAFVLSWYSGITFFYFNSYIEIELFGAFLCGLPLVCISLLDDIYNLNYKYKLAVQGLAAAGALYFTGGLTKLDLGIVVLNYDVLLTVTAFIGIVWFINLFNFLDGIDGYAGTEAVFISFAVFVIYSDKAILIMAFSVLGFLLWNWPKAKIFMGDSGSTLLGFNFAVFAIWHQNQGISSLLIWAILSALFWFDATLTLYRRFWNNENLGEAHKKHAYQRIVQAGFSHKKTIISAIIINILLFTLAFLSVTFYKFIIAFFVTELIILYGLVRLVDNKKSFA